ncbi:MAG: Spy/CpxP family protein refolding chaperone [Muribaculaceae bacterium]
MKKTIVLAFALMMGASIVMAQRDGSRRGLSVDDRVAMLTKELSLTDQQQKKVKALYTDFENKQKSGTSQSREQMRAEFEKVDNQVIALLNDTQKKKYEEMKKNRRNKHK